MERGYNGNLFKPDPEIDSLQLEDEPWIRGFKNFGNYDFSEEVNVEVLGHLFERSITELEKLRVGGLFALQAHRETNRPPAMRTRQPVAEARRSVSKMPKSAQAQTLGIYYTPAAFTGLIVERTDRRDDQRTISRFARRSTKSIPIAGPAKPESTARLLVRLPGGTQAGHRLRSGLRVGRSF